MEQRRQRRRVVVAVVTDLHGGSVSFTVMNRHPDGFGMPTAAPLRSLQQGRAVKHGLAASDPVRCGTL
jgi:hypothetical protein